MLKDKMKNIFYEKYPERFKIEPRQGYIIGVDKAAGPAMFPVANRQCENCDNNADHFYGGIPFMGQYWQLCKQCSIELGKQH
jgi:hypothetical protein